jgi:MFS family permease
MPADQPPSQIRRGLAFTFREGAVVSGMFACTELWLIPLIKQGMGASDAVIGLLAIVPQIALIVLGLAIRPLVLALGGNKRTAVLSSLVQVGALLALSLPLHVPDQPWSVPLAAGLIMLLGVIGGIGGPAWVAWMGDLIPRSIRGRFTSRRNAAFNATRLAYVAAFAGIMQVLPIHGGPWGLQAVLLIAAASRLWSVRYQSLTPEPQSRPVFSQSPSQRLQVAEVGFLVFVRTLHRTTLGRWTLVWGSLFGGMMVSGPFFAPYMLAAQAEGGLALTPLWYSFLINVNPVTKLITYPAAGRLVEIHGAAAMLRFATILLLIVPLGWAFSSNIWVIVGFEVLSGIAWASLEVAIGVLLFSCHPDPLTRSRLIGYHQAVFGCFSLTGGIIGTVLISWEGLPTFDGNRFHTIFLISLALRLPALVLALVFLPALKKRVEEDGELWQLIPGAGLVMSAGRGLTGYFQRPEG